MKTEVLTPDQEGIRLAAAALREGRLVAFPTETVYGLGAAATMPEAVRGVFRAKGRPADHPLIVHLASAAALGGWTAAGDRQLARAERLARQFWPGPLTLVLPRSGAVPPEVTGGQDTVAVRVPAHPVAQALLEETGLALVAPSANRFGRISPTRAGHVLEELGGLIPFVLDGGPSRVGIESTILDLSGEAPRLLRPGMIGTGELEAALGEPLVAAAGPGSIPRVSGSLRSHYAPATRTLLLGETELAQQLRADGAAAVLAFREPPPGHAGPWITLPPSPGAAAAQLYAALRELDGRAAVILVELPPAGPEWTAVRDRLGRAAAEKEQE